jgi:hypothetical protein
VARYKPTRTVDHPRAQHFSRPEQRGAWHEGDHGYAPEATGAVLDCAFGVLRLLRVAFAVDAANQRSVRLMRRLGFCELPNLHPAAADSFLGALDNPACPRGR